MAGAYDLTGTFRAMEEAKHCVLTYLNYPQIAAPQPSRSPERSQPSTARTTDLESPVDPAYLYQLATVMITEAQVQDFEYLTDQEKTQYGLMPGAVYWRSNALQLIAGIGATRVDPNADLGALGVQDVQSFAKECTGDVVTGSRAIAQADFPGREIRAACSAGASSYDLYLTKTLVGDILIETLLYFAGEPSSKTKQNRQLTEDIRVRTASFVASTGSKQAGQ